MDSEYLSIEYEDDVAIVILDQAGRSVNTLSTAMLDAIDETLHELISREATTAVVIMSGKDAGFIAGADVRELKELPSPAMAEALSRRGHDMIRRVRAQKKPIIAAIHGAALGGGLELALACDMRIASDDAVLGLPEVKLGLLPGGGGTQLLPRLIGVQEALGMMLTGKNVYARKARRIGLVDSTIHRPGLRQAAIRAARDLASEPGRGHADKRALGTRLLEGNALTRRIIYKKALERVERQTRGNYPAPYLILDAVRTGLEDGLDAGFELEARYFGELVFSPVSRNLVFLFFAQQEASRSPWTDLVEPISTLGVLGGGLMGGGIAALSARNGINVRIKDIDLEHAASARKVAAEYAEGLERKGAMSSFESDALVERVLPVRDYQDFSGVDAVIEAVPEALDVKHEVLRATEGVIASSSVYASNTSSIPIARIAEAAEHPERVIGMHYFSPVPRVPLLEVVRTEANSDAVVARAFEIGLRQGKTVIVVNDGPGFYTTRILAIYMNEALLLLEEGGRIDQIDQAIRDFGFPMGPFALFDLVGIDVAAKIADVLDPFFSVRGHRSSNLSSRLLTAELKGHKTMRGFYQYEEGRRGHPEKRGLNETVYAHAGGAQRKDLEPKEIVDRLSLIMVNEAVRCLDEGILNRPQDGDVGAVFGLGFPPFRGGPFKHVDQVGARRLLHKLSDLEAQHGLRFDPAMGIVERSKNDARFYD
jgi:3-hydroxyacyl-CoA dehydrogenase / enoyl-CoA hydratase / 3-hydroxybutyryl-CoA epimerase